MGAAAGVYLHDQSIPESIKAAFQRNDEMKLEMAKKDAQFIYEQSQQNWVDHKSLIKLLCERSKIQLHRIAEVYQKDKKHGGYGVFLEQKLVDIIGGPYGNFVRDCVMKSEALDAEYVHLTLNSIGCNENVLAEVLCATTCEELKATAQYYQGVLKKPLIDKVMSKTTANSPFQKFCRHILSYSRHPSTLSISEADAKHQAQLLFSYGFTDPSLPREDEKIFQILCYASRGECQTISDQYESLYSMDLVTAILAKYKGAIALGLLLWTASLNDAIVKRIQINLTDPTVRKNGLDFRHLSHLFAKYDHWKIKILLSRYREIYEEDLIPLVSKKLSGNYKKAVLKWLGTDETCDGGYEFRIIKLMETYRQKNPITTAAAGGGTGTAARGPLAHSSSSSSHHSNELQQVEVLLEKERESLQQYMATHAIITSASGRGSGILSSSTKDERNNEGYQRMFNLVKDFLLRRFQEEDRDHTGTLDPNEFWTLLYNLQIGYSNEDIQNLKQWVDMDGDGKITFEEIIQELTHCVIGEIEENLQISVEEKIRQLDQQLQQDIIASSSSAKNNNSPSIDYSEHHTVSPNLATYLYDSFQAADTDMNGKLDNTEFWNILRTVLSLSEGDREILEQEWDTNHDGVISWTEALEHFAIIFKKYINTNQDHWIALVDKTNGQFFWYNLKDENSFWMTEEDQQRYQQMIKDGSQNEEPLKPSHVPAPQRR